MALKALFDEIVDAIHEKDGLSDGIVATDFPDRIRDIQTGVALDSIQIVTPPTKISYTTGESFDPDGIVVSAHFANGYDLLVPLPYLTFSPDGMLVEDTDQITVQFQWGDNTYSAVQAVSVSIHPIYGAQWDGSSTTILTRTGAAAVFADPVPAVGDGSGFSQFNKIYPWSGMVRVSQDGNELVAIPKYWVKVSHNPFHVQISGTPIDGYQVSPAHRDRGDGKGERDVVYIGRYECDDSYMSRSGQSPKTVATIATFRSEIHNLGANYWQADYALQLTWWFLYIVEYANWNGQTAIGYGNVNSGAKINTGATDSMVYHTGRAAGADKKTAVQYRWIENPWGNVSEFRDGIYFSDANICTYNNPANFSNSYNGTGATVRSNKRNTSSGFIKVWGYDTNDPSFIYPSAVGGTSLTYIPDYIFYSTSGYTLNVGGYYSSNDSAGPFHLTGNNPNNKILNYLGSRLQKLP